MNIVIDLSQESLGLVLKDYQEMIMKLLWQQDVGNGLNSREVWEAVNTELKGSSRGSISRASIINFLNSMVDAEFLGFHEETGKGGHRRIYHARATQERFWRIIASEAKRRMAEASGIKDLFG